MFTILDYDSGTRETLWSKLYHIAKRGDKVKVMCDYGINGSTRIKDAAITIIKDEFGYGNLAECKNDNARIVVRITQLFWINYDDTSIHFKLY